MGNTLMKVVACESGRLDVRRGRLFLCACVRRMDRGDRGTFREAVELAERHADGLAGPDEVRSMRFTYKYQFKHPAGMLLWPDENGGLDLVQRGLAWLEAFDPSDAGQAARLALWRDLTGGEGVRFDPAWAAWEGGTVRRLAEAIDRGRDYVQMPILGDALEEAGCADGAVLGHCRGGGPHARGCWVLDGLRG
ncbi:MAG: hypothetical protein ACRC33_11395 [Gemmataceae bacterium]